MAENKPALGEVSAGKRTWVWHTHKDEESVDVVCIVSDHAAVMLDQVILDPSPARHRASKVLAQRPGKPLVHT